jgi:hypothetical protein
MYYSCNNIEVRNKYAKIYSYLSSFNKCIISADYKFNSAFNIAINEVVIG